MLQALRPLLPNAWFFTTDLDALLLHPGAQTLTRNLLVASSFGLQLGSDIQGEIPPFRSGYQTAQFLATRVAARSESSSQKELAAAAPDVRDRDLARVSICPCGQA